jgi:beta-catenin-like protein 1
VEETDKQGVFHILGTFENILSFMPPLAEQIVSKTTLLPWLLERIQAKVYDSGKQYASEILSILIQQDRANRLRMTDLDGVDTLLRVLSVGLVRNPLTIAIQEEGSRGRRRGGIHGEHI